MDHRSRYLAPKSNPFDSEEDNYIDQGRNKRNENRRMEEDESSGSDSEMKTTSSSIDPEVTKKRHLLGEVMNGQLEGLEASVPMERDDDNKGNTTKIDGEGGSKAGTNNIQQPSLNKEDDVEDVEGMCVECRDQPIAGYCEQCSDDYCEVCWQALHRRGKRRTHKFLLLNVSNTTNVSSDAKNGAAPSQAVTDTMEDSSDDGESLKNDTNNDNPNAYPFEYTRHGGAFSSGGNQVRIPRGLDAPRKAVQNGSVNNGRPSSNLQVSFLDRAKYIPVRLAYEERKQFRLLEAALNVSEYTDKVDVYVWNQSKIKRMAAQIKEMCAILSALVIANDYNRGQQLLKNHDYSDLAAHFQQIFEIGRRYKINNPDKMRSDFGKLMYLLQDSVSPHVQDLLNFDCITPLKTVYKFLEDRDCLAVLEDEYMDSATKEITSDGKSRGQVSHEIKQKEMAQKYLGKKYSNTKINSDEVMQCLYSIGDNNSYLRSNRDCCDKMIAYLQHFFSPDQSEDDGFLLTISGGRSGARLTHSHSRQYNYVLQSLTLWREILNDMFKLWYLAEEDLLDSSLPYRLVDTGQGLNRVQSAPRVSRAIHNILHRVQSSVRDWVGSSVVHLGDHNVPNAFFFLTKYLSVAPILNPIDICLDKIDELANDPDLRAYLQAKGGPDTVKRTILCDFFKHAFDGSGADNFFDAGSCIDGRLTSAWNWCSKIEKKPYFPVFLLTGFVGFDGE